MPAGSAPNQAWGSRLSPAHCRAAQYWADDGDDAGDLRGSLLGVLGKPIQRQMVVLGSMSLGGNIVPVENLAESLQVAFDAGPSAS